MSKPKLSAIHRLMLSSALLSAAQQAPSQAPVKKPGCRVNGLVAPGGMCGSHLVGGGCGFTGQCKHKEGAA